MHSLLWLILARKSSPVLDHTLSCLSTLLTPPHPNPNPIPRHDECACVCVRVNEHTVINIICNPPHPNPTWSACSACVCIWTWRLWALGHSTPTPPQDMMSVQCPCVHGLVNVLAQNMVSVYCLCDRGERYWHPTPPQTECADEFLTVARPEPARILEDAEHWHFLDLCCRLQAVGNGSEASTGRNKWRSTVERYIDRFGWCTESCTIMSVWVGCKRTLTHIDASVKAGFMLDFDRFGCWCWPQDVWVEMCSFVFLFPPLWFWLVLIHIKGLNWSLATSSPCNSRVCNQLRLWQVAHFAGPFHPMSPLNRVGPGSCGARRNPTLQRSWPVRQVLWQQLVVFSWLWFVGSGIFCWPNLEVFCLGILGAAVATSDDSKKASI